ncbi:MAG: hypothetical protein ABSA75_13445 [Candidatus Bathyarchaeia archaeon]|jgi:hypothetical protein
MSKGKKPEPKVNLRAVQNANLALITLFSEILETVRKGIDVGNVNMPQGLISTIILADILHGGAYAVPSNELPFYLSDPSLSKYWAGSVKTNEGADTGLAGDIANVFGVQNADYTYREINQDSNVPHVFPKLLSDQAYATIRATFQWLTTQAAFTAGVTNVATLVKTGGEFIKNTGAGIKDVEEGEAANTKAATDVIGALTQLIPKTGK